MSSLLIVRAASFAADKHRKQRRKGADGNPYINHPLEVARLLAEHGIDDAIVLAGAILHDTVEDTDTSFDELTEAFGKEVSDIVRECTDDKNLPKVDRKRLQIEHTPNMSDRGKLVKLADKTSNVTDIHRSPPQWPIERRLAYFDWAEAVIAGLRGVHPELEALFDARLADGRAALS